jgi:rhamnosyltransferase
LNSDCEPVDEYWLKRLIDAMDDPAVGAAFGRQMPRPGCFSWFERDTEATFGDGKEQAKWRHCFSMANSILRREAWEAEPFNEKIAYSEDVELTLRIKNRGFEIRYVPESRVLHSHNYTWKQYYKRQFGEGKAEAAIWEWSRFQRSWLRYSALPYLRQIGRDFSYCVPKGRAGDAVKAIYVRTAQLLGRRKGFLAGLREGQGR